MAGRPPDPNPSPGALRQRASRANRAQTQVAPSPVLATAPPPAATVSEPSPAPARPLRDPVTPPTTPKPIGSTEQAAEDYAAQCKGELDLAIQRGEPMTVRAALSTSYRAAFDQLRKVRGEDELTEASLARSSVFRRYRDRLLAALVPHPAALRDVRAAIAELEGQS